MFRFAFVVLAAIGLGALLFGGAGSAAAGIGLLALIPVLFLSKLLFIAMIFGMLARSGLGHRRISDDYRSSWAGSGKSRRPSPSSGTKEGPSEAERFEEWHRLSHAREEVDSWAPEVD